MPAQVGVTRYLTKLGNYYLFQPLKIIVCEEDEEGKGTFFMKNDTSIDYIIPGGKGETVSRIFVGGKWTINDTYAFLVETNAITDIDNRMNSDFVKIISDEFESRTTVDGVGSLSFDIGMLTSRYIDSGIPAEEIILVFEMAKARLKKYYE